MRARQTAYGGESEKPNELIQEFYRNGKAYRRRVRDFQRLQHEIMHEERKRCDQASGYQEEEPGSRRPNRWGEYLFHLEFFNVSG